VNRKHSRARAEAIFSVTCKIDLGKPTSICKMTFYELFDENGNPKGTATVTKDLPHPKIHQKP
jgi:hypothetical protein